jgi:hypothetical protein
LAKRDGISLKYILVKKRESIKADTSKEEDTIDKIVYELFQMDEDTIKMVEEYK